MPFDKKAWEDANKEKVLLYAHRNRLKRRGIDPDVAAPLPTLTPEQKAAKRAESRERILAAKRVYDAAHREEKARRYRERYENDPDFRARQHEKRRQYYWANKKVLSEEEKATRLRRRQEALAKARRVYAAQRRAESEARLAEAKQCAKDLERAAKKAKAAARVVKKPGRILALSGWKGWG
jgi:hypothetical protein